MLYSTMYCTVCTRIIAQKVLLYDDTERLRCLKSRDVPDTTLPDTGFNRIVVYRIYRIVASLNITVREWNENTIVSVVYNWNLNKTCMCFHLFIYLFSSGSLQMNARLVKPALVQVSLHQFHQPQKPKYYPVNIR